MSTISLRIPESLHKEVKSVVEKEHVSINQFLCSALAEKIAAFMTEEYLGKKAIRGDRTKFMRALSKISKVSPEEYDRI